LAGTVVEHGNKYILSSGGEAHGFQQKHLIHQLTSEVVQWGWGGLIGRVRINRVILDRPWCCYIPASRDGTPAVVCTYSEHV
jgi:hypothetical protein